MANMAPDIWLAQPESRTAMVATTVFLTASVLALLRYKLYPTRARILSSPLKTVIPKLSEDEKKALLYAPDYFPGARDVQTPYGSIRVYEFGPEAGRKVLMMHGISTSCMTLTHIAHGLAARGCRVMLFDLFGRGYTDGVGDLPFDARLYVSQALCVLASSPLPWTGAGGFSLIGYSLGGGIAVQLATAFPHMVETLILLAPAGMIRSENFGTVANLVFRAGLVPDGVLEGLTRRRLQKPIAASARRRIPSATDSSTPAAANGNGAGTVSSSKPQIPGEKAVDAAIAEAADPVDQEKPSPLQRRVWKCISWQVANHVGFIPAFMSTLRFAPMIGENEAYAKLADRKAGTTCFIFGDGDSIVNEEDYRADALPLAGGLDKISWSILPGGHDFPMSHQEETLEKIFEFWSWKGKE